MKTPKFLPGDYYAALDKERGLYKLYRILSVEPYFGAIHISIYSNLFPEVPTAIEPETLTFGLLTASADGDQATFTAEVDSGNTLSGILEAMTDKRNHYGIMHLPLSLEGFQRDEFYFVGHRQLEAEDLEGFRAYLDGMEYSESEQEEYVDFVISRSADRSLFRIDRRLRWVLPVLAVFMVLTYFLNWFHPAVVIIGLLLIFGLGWFWWTRVMKYINLYYQQESPAA